MKILIQDHNHAKKPIGKELTIPGKKKTKTKEQYCDTSGGSPVKNKLNAETKQPHFKTRLSIQARRVQNQNHCYVVVQLLCGGARLLIYAPNPSKSNSKGQLLRSPASASST